MSQRRSWDETPFWTVLAAVFPLIIYPAGYDSFHEPKWLALTAFAGILLVFRAAVGKDLFGFMTPLEPPILFLLGATLFSLRWSAPDHWIAFAFWFRSVLVYLLFRMLVTWLREGEGEHFNSRVIRVQNALLLGACGVATMALWQDWGYGRWSNQPVSDWRFHLSSTLGNPNEVGGYLSYLIPILLARWLEPGKSLGQKILWLLPFALVLFALTTVFTVGAWLGLIAVLPLGLGLLVPSKERDPGREKIPLWGGYLLSGLVFAFLQTALRLPPDLMRTLALLGIAALLFIALFWLLRRHARQSRWLAAGALGLLLGIWTVLLFPWGIPNHPEGLVAEAVASPRWKGGFGARRFIWRTTGLMVKDHPMVGIGWGHYYHQHALYQGEVYRQRGVPHDRPTVGLVPQVHSDPLQVMAEAGFLGALGFFWLAAAAVQLGRRRIPPLWASDPQRGTLLLACWLGLGLIGFHCAVDFPLRQPQPALLAVFFLACLSAIPAGRKPGKSISTDGSTPMDLGERVLVVFLGLVFLGTGVLGMRDQALLKQGFTGFSRAVAIPDPALRRATLLTAAEDLDRIAYPLPETHDRYIYRARIAIALGNFAEAEAFLLEAGKYRHSMGLYEAWVDLGTAQRNPSLVLHGLRGLQIYNPAWAPFYEESAKLEELLGNPEEAERDRALAEKYRVR
jgi:hypothetical protein